MWLAPEKWIEKRVKQYVDTTHKYAKKPRKFTLFLTSAFEMILIIQEIYGEI